jgi:signal transduction histidine kinase/DNA-binding response OmpR family regulator/Tfp pilus assembly protein PilF
MVRFYITLLCCLGLERASAQTEIIDSLVQQLDTHPRADTNRVIVLNALSDQYLLLDFNRSLAYANEAFDIAQSLSYNKGIATACSHQALSFLSLGDSERAIERALTVVNIAENHGPTDILAETYRIMAFCYRDQGDLDKAVNYVRRAERLALGEKNWDLLARIYNTAGVIARSRDQKDSALVFYNRSLQISAEHPTRKFQLSQVVSNMGEIFLAEDVDKGLRYFIKALSLARETGNKPSEAGIMGDIGRAYIIKKQYGDADLYLNQSLKMAHKLGLKRISRYAYYALADLKLHEGKTTEAFNYMNAYYAVRDSLLNAAQTRQIVELEASFEKEQQDQKIKLLEQEHQIERLWKNVLIAGTLLLMVVGLIIYRLQRLRSEKTKQLLETQKSLNEQLTETDLMKSRFYANISHEFRTPLTLILGPLESQLKNSNLSLIDKKELKIVQRNAHRLLDLVNQLLDLSKLEAGKMELAALPGNLTKFLYLITASFESLAEHKQISFLKNIPTIEYPVVFDKDKLEKIITNILINAFKFTPAGGQVGISVHTITEKDELIICVADTGKGIPKEEQSRIFSPFYQLKYESEDGGAGTGLGLSLVNELVKLYGGKIELASQLDQGTFITITLPLPKSSITAEPQTSSKDHVGTRPLPLAVEHDLVSLHPDEEAETILIVEDNFELRHFIASGFRNKFKILMASDGGQGLAKALDVIPDVIISDVMMPGVNGLEFTNHIKNDERTSHIPLILLTARADDESRLSGLRFGADEYLSKPFLMEELQIRVSNILEQRRRLADKLKEEVMLTSTLSDSNETSLDEKFTMKLKATIEEHLGNSSFGVEILAEKMNLSRAHLFRKVKALINTSPSEFINDLRLQKAAQMIRSRADHVSQIAYAVGYNEQSYFSKRFRKKFGMSPTDYAKQNVVHQDYL